MLYLFNTELQNANYATWKYRKICYIKIQGPLMQHTVRNAIYLFNTELQNASYATHSTRCYLFNTEIQNVTRATQYEMLLIQCRTTTCYLCNTQ